VRIFFASLICFSVLYALSLNPFLPFQFWLLKIYVSKVALLNFIQLVALTLEIETQLLNKALKPC
jgi:hypothetical protein